MKRKNGLAAHHSLLLLRFLAATICFCAPSLFSQPVLQLSAAGTNATVNDNSLSPPVDNNSWSGVVDFGGSLPGWTFNSVSGITKPFYGSFTNANIELDAQVSGRGAFTNLFSEQHFSSPTPRTLVADFAGGTMAPGCAVTARVYYGSALLDRSQLLLELVPTSGGTSFFSTTNVLLPALADFSLTLELVFTRDSTNQSDGSFRVVFLARLPTTVDLTGSTRLGTNGPPLSGVSVDLSTNGTTFRNASTDSKGVYRLLDLPFGNYTVTPSSADFAFSPPSQFVDAQTYTTLPPFVATPRLRIERGVPEVNLSWSGAATNLQLQSASALPGTWTAVTNPPSLQLERWRVMVPAHEPARFFQLIGP